MGRYPFGVELFHLLLHAGLSRRFHKIEHRLFSQITMNWRGRPLTSHETILQLIGVLIANLREEDRDAAV